MVDNFELIANKLFDNLKEDEFYFLQVLVRGKDVGANCNKVIKYYVVKSAEQLNSLKEEIVALCGIHHARAYIHPTKRNAREVANLVLELTAHTFISQQWLGLKNVFPTACGKSFVNGDKKFVVDLDGVEIGDSTFKSVESFITKIRGRGGENTNKTFMAVPTKHGCHLITYPFDLGEFGRIYQGIDVHKNNPTVLYCL